MPSRNHGINANIEILVIPVNLPVGNGNIPTPILWQQSIKISLIPNGISFQMFKVLHMFAPRGEVLYHKPNSLFTNSASAIFQFGVR